MNIKRQEILERISKEAAEAGVEVNWEHLNSAPIPALNFVRLMLQLHKGDKNRDR